MPDAERSGYIVTTFQELLNAIDDVAANDDEAFAVLMSMLVERRISLISPSRSREEQAARFAS